MYGSQTTISFSGMPMRVSGVAAQVLVGQEEKLRILARSAHLNARAAFDDVQTTPPRSPQKALIAAVEFM